MQPLEISIQPDSEHLGAEAFYVRAMLPKTVDEVIVNIATGAANLYFGGFTELGDLDVMVQDYELDGDRLLWAAAVIGNTNCTFLALDDGIQVNMTVPKLPEGDDRLDWIGFLEKHAGKLPGNYWIEPARILRTILQPVMHRGGHHG